ncbi:MAG TPA: isoprenylcysteine carboxylmethyltransferase family protein [Ignavibacteria bacterium]|nr:isoprenylcysteine carboxylmethyltransferase family protein [Ignavibacteria bacterium]
MPFFWYLIIFLILQRLIELVISKRNEKWLLSQGAVEYGKEHYKFIVLLHAGFFISLIVEYVFTKGNFELHLINYVFLVIFIILQICRVIILSTLGRYWNTRIIRIPNTPLVAKGIYRYVKHPNYVLVICEIFVIPMIFDLYWTAIIFTVLNLVILNIRVKEENKALNYT